MIAPGLSASQPPHHEKVLLATITSVQRAHQREIFERLVLAGDHVHRAREVERLLDTTRDRRRRRRTRHSGAARRCSAAARR